MILVSNQCLYIACYTITASIFTRPMIHPILSRWIACLWTDLLVMSSDISAEWFLSRFLGWQSSFWVYFTKVLWRFMRLIFRVAVEHPKLVEEWANYNVDYSTLMIFYIILNCAQISVLIQTAIFCLYNIKIPNSNYRIFSKYKVILTDRNLRTCTWKPAAGASHSAKRTNRRPNGVLCWKKTMLEAKKNITFMCDPSLDIILISIPPFPNM